MTDNGAYPVVVDVNGARLTDEQRKNVPVTRAEFEHVAKQVEEIHAFIKGVGEALNNPMLKSMLPPQMRGMI